MTRLSRFLVPVVVVLALATTVFGRPQTPVGVDRISPRSLAVQLRTIDQYLRVKDLSRAHVMLDELAGQGASRGQLLPRLVQLARLLGDWEKVVELSREFLAVDPDDLLMRREIGAALIQTGDLAAAAVELDRFVAAHPNPSGGGVVVVALWRDAGYPGRALAVCDSLRTDMGQAGYLSRLRAACLLDLSRPQEAADEIVQSLGTNPRNLLLIRRELLGRAASSPDSLEVLRGLRRHATADGAGDGERILLLSMLLLLGEDTAALDVAREVMLTAQGQRELLKLLPVLVREAPLEQDERVRRAGSDFLLPVFEELAGSRLISVGLRQRCLFLLAETCEGALRRGDLGDDPLQAVVRFSEYLDLVRAGLPASEHLFLAQILLAEFTRDELDRPDLAVVRLERLLVDPELPTAGIALARLSLGESCLAAADTARARAVLTQLGRDGEFRRAAGNAHYLLARLDLAEGHWQTAKDRFATVAWDNPRAPYANDALELGLLIAEELVNVTGGPALLDLYSRVVYAELVGDGRARGPALEDFIAGALGLVDLDEAQYLLERARFELAGWYAEAGRLEAALSVCETIVADHPDGRRAPQALEFAGRLYRQRGDGERSREVWQRLLSQYPEYIFADDLRDELRSLP